MSYCPEDGTEMKPAGSGPSHSCYDCPACNTHWCYNTDLMPYVGYLIVENRAECLYAAWHEGIKVKDRMWLVQWTLHCQRTVEAQTPDQAIEMAKQLGPDPEGTVEGEPPTAALLED